jgi:hypothetical protein
MISIVVAASAQPPPTIFRTAYGAASFPSAAGSHVAQLGTTDEDKDRLLLMLPAEASRIILLASVCFEKAIMVAGF